VTGEVGEFRNSGFGVLLFVSPWVAEEVKGSLLMTFTIGASYVTQTIDTNPINKRFQSLLQESFNTKFQFPCKWP